MRSVYLTVFLVMCATTSALDSVAQDPPPLWEQLFLQNIEPLQYGAAAWGDFNGDGNFDLIYTGSTTDFEVATPFTQLYVNMGEVSREIPNPGGEPIIVFGIDYLELGFDDVFQIPLWRSSAAWGDVNGDGRLDILMMGITNLEERLLLVYLQMPPEAQRPFALAYVLPGLSDGDLKLADIDNDGDQDIILSGYDEENNPLSTIYENLVLTERRFAPLSVNLIHVGQSSIAVGDYDNDQDLDLIITGIGSPQEFITRLYRNDGRGNFFPTTDSFIPLLGASVDWGDYDADGDLDLLYSGGILTPFLLQGEIYVYQNNGGSFSPDGVTIIGSFVEDPAFGRYRGSAQWGDFNNDGFLDFLVAGSMGPQLTRTGQAFQNQQSNIFTHSNIGLHGRFSGGLFGTTFWGDFDNDGDLDIFSLGFDEARGNVSQVLRNYLPWYPRNRVPQASTETSSTVLGNQVTLSWNAGRDSSTPTPALTYNVRIGSSKGASDVMPAMASPDNGLRYVSAHGNVQNNLSWTIHDLAPGKYYWAVQTIDTSYKGSPFTEEATFTILQ